VIRVRIRDGDLEWESTIDAESPVRRLLRLADDLEAIVAAGPNDPLLREAYEAHRGMRLVADPPFGCLISFICSAQMRVGRIHTMVSTLAREYGDEIDFDGETYHAFPTPEQLATATEAELRELGLGYRAPYVVRTAEMVASGEDHPAEARDLPYEDAREYLTRFVGVGDKVADCVLLFSLDFDEAVPLDTWIKSAIEEYYPDCDRGTYADTSRALRERLGGEYAGTPRPTSFITSGLAHRDVAERDTRDDFHEWIVIIAVWRQAQSSASLHRRCSSPHWESSSSTSGWFD